MSLINPNTEHIYLYITSSVIYLYRFKVGYPSSLYVRSYINVLATLFVLSFPISVFNGLLSVTVVAMGIALSLSRSKHHSESSPAGAKAITADWMF